MRPSDLANGGEIADFYCGEYIADFSRENRGLFAQVKFMDGFDPDSRCLELKPLADFAKWNVSAKRHERAEEFDIDLGKFKGIGPVPEQLSAAV